MIRLYFRPSGDARPTKDEVASFITNEIGLTHADGDVMSLYTLHGEYEDAMPQIGV